MASHRKVVAEIFNCCAVCGVQFHGKRPDSGLCPECEKKETGRIKLEEDKRPVTLGDLKAFVKKNWITYISQLVGDDVLTLYYRPGCDGVVYLVEYGPRRMYCGPYDFLAVSTYNKIAGESP